MARTVDAAAAEATVEDGAVDEDAVSDAAVDAEAAVDEAMAVDEAVAADYAYGKAFLVTTGGPCVTFSLVG